MAQLKDLIVTGPSRFVGTVYVNDIQGKISNASVADSANSVAWSNITGKPTDHATTSYVDGKIAALVNSAPATLDTLGELAAALKDNKDIVTVLEQSIGNKQDKSTAITTSNIGSQTVSHAATATDARCVVADNNAVLPQGALLHSGYNRADDATGDTWIYYDSLGGADAPWGIKHNQTDNYIEFYGAGDPKSFINLSTGNHYSKGFVNPDYRSAEHALTSDGGVAHIPSMRVAYASEAGTAGSANSVAWDNVSGRPSSLPASDVSAWAKKSSLEASDVPDLSGSYLSTSGGTINGTLAVNGYIAHKSHFIGVNDNENAEWYVTDQNWNRQYTLIHDGNIGSQSVNYANSAGSATNATNATYATYDSNGNYIVDTYATKGEIPSIPSSLPANGGTATNAYNDQNGSNIVNTYATRDWVSSNFNYSADSWRPITDSYSGSEQGTSLSQYGANALYNALVNGYAAEAGYASSAGSANSVAWSNVSGRPTSVSQFTNDSGYATQSWVSSNFNYSTDTWRPVYDGVDSSATDTSASANAVRLAYSRADSAYNLAAGKQDAISDLSTIRSQASNGNTAYSWGNHANAGYLNTSSIVTDSGSPIVNNTVAPTEMISFNGLIGNGTVFSRNGSLFVADNPFMPVSTHWLDAWSDPDSYGGHNYRGQIELDLYPDRFYDFTYTPLISGIKINSIPGWNTDGLISHNIVRFRPGMGGFTLTVPSGIYWANGVPTEFENNNAMYELSFIRRGIDSITATWTKFTLE